MAVDRETFMLESAPEYYQTSRFYTAQNSAKAAEFSIIHNLFDEALLQFNPQTATWGLWIWEEMLELQTNKALSTERRRAEIIKKLTAIQKITPIAMERLVKRVTGANIDIIRNVKPYTFQVRVRDDSLDADDRYIKNVVKEYKEAHMAFNFAFYMGVIINKEIFIVRSIHRLRMYWFGYYGGYLNGVYDLDGEIYLNTPWPLPMHALTIHRLKLFSKEQFFGRANIVIPVKFKEHVQLRKVTNRFIAFWWDARMLNGRFNLDGEYPLNAHFSPNFPPYRGITRHRLKVRSEEKLNHASVHIKKNLWFLDGSRLLDGSKLINAYERKEEL